MELSAAGIDWVGVAGIIGTLGGVIVGAVTTYKIQERKIDHLDETRFHEQRLSAYKSFSAGIIICAAHWKSGGHSQEGFTQIFESMEAIRMVASRAVLDAAVEGHSIFSELLSLEDRRNAPEELYERLNSSMVKFNLAARNELKIVGA